MKIVEALPVLALISISIGGASDPLSPAARDLLQKPRIGPAVFTLRDGTTVKGNVGRVTNQYVVFQQSLTCENIDVAKIARIKYLPYNDDLNPAETVGMVMLTAIAAPFWLGPTLKNVFRDKNLIGIWQSVLPATGGSGTWVEFREQNFLDRQLIHVRRGTYRLLGESLKLTYSDNLSEETIAISFTCNQMTLNLPSPLTLRWYDNPSNRADDPIVGRWHRGIRDGYWAFKADGTFETKTTDNLARGTFTKKPNGELTIHWHTPPGIPEEEWSAKLSHGRLFLTAKGGTTEYERRESRL